MPVLNFGKCDLEALVREAELRKDGFIVERPFDSEGETRFFQAIFTSWMLLDWICERQEQEICEDYGVGPGDIRRLVESADWLLYAAAQIAGFLKLNEAQPALRTLRKRVLYGIKEELLELVSLSGIGRVRARNLFESGYKTLTGIRAASVKQLSKVKAIGPGIAASIKKQVK